MSCEGAKEEARKKLVSFIREALRKPPQDPHVVILPLRGHDYDRENPMYVLYGQCLGRANKHGENRDPQTVAFRGVPMNNDLERRSISAKLLRIDWDPENGGSGVVKLTRLTDGRSPQVVQYKNADQDGYQDLQSGRCRSVGRGSRFRFKVLNTECEFEIEDYTPVDPRSITRTLPH
jgi:hypothetical protein